MSLISELITRMTLDSKQFEAKLSSIERQVQMMSSRSSLAFSKLGGGLALTGLTLLGRSVVKIADDIDEITDAAENLNIGVEQFQALSYAANQLGSSTGALSNMLDKMQKTIGNAANGSKKANDALKRVGLTVEELIGLSPDEQFRKVAKAIADLGDHTPQTASASEILGKNGSKSLTLLTSNLDESTSKAKELGQVLSNDTAKAVGDLSDKFGALGTSIKNTFATLIASASPAINLLLDGFSNILNAVNSIDAAVIGMTKEAFGIGAYDPNADGKPRAKAYVPTDYSNFDYGGAKANQSFNESLGGLTQERSMDDIIRDIETRERMLTSSFEKIGSAVDKAKNSFQDFVSRMDQLQNLRNNRYDDYSGKKQLESQEFEDTAKDLIDKQLSGTLSSSYARSKLKELKMITDNNLQFNDKGELEEVSTSKLKGDLKQLQELLLGDKNKNTVEITVNPSEEFNTKITKISENSFTNLLTKEATGVNR